MPRFPVSFGKRRSTADSLENGAVAAEPSFRVLERPDVPNAKNFDAGVRNSVYKPSHNPKASISVDLAPMDDNMFADLKSTNRYVPSRSFYLYFAFLIVPLPVNIRESKKS